ncbi:hypothetical protein ACFSSF_15815 [Dietzia aerolata]|uniref:hypothetical protein n=1 Tax=Dietzia aerolata TaxID=595984 RepID=UPI00362EF40C
MACDLPGLDAATLGTLVDTVRTSGVAAALGVDAAGHEQYLLAAWDRRALAARLARLEASGGTAGRPVRALFAPVDGGAGGGETHDHDDDNSSTPSSSTCPWATPRTTSTPGPTWPDADRWRSPTSAPSWPRRWIPCRRCIARL